VSVCVWLHYMLQLVCWGWHLPTPCALPCAHIQAMFAWQLV
jgi:hypothetical protein